MSTELGRLSSSEASQPVPYDSPEKTMSAVLSKQDAIIDALKALTAKLDADGGVATDYAATITASLSKIDLRL